MRALNQQEIHQISAGYQDTHPFFWGGMSIAAGLGAGYFAMMVTAGVDDCLNVPPHPLKYHLAVGAVVFLITTGLICQSHVSDFEQ